MKAKKPYRPISRLDAADSRLLKKEFLRLIRMRLSIVRSLCETDQQALELVKAAVQKEDDFEAEIEALIWNFVAIRLEMAISEEKGE